jgi:phospholipid/cholesterol/gamma-HCH transport system substrate-binding protein
MTRDKARVALAVGLVLILAGGVAALCSQPIIGRTHIVAYFDNSNGIYAGDDVVILGVKAGRIENIEPQPLRAKITFWVDDKYKVPASVDAVILSPKLITSRAIQLTPVYTAGPVLADGAEIPQSRTAVPMEFDDLRQQLEKLSQSLQPTQPDGASPLGTVIDTAADNLRGQGSHIRDTLNKLSQAVSVLGDHSGDIFSTVKNLSILVSALHDSADLMRQLNNNLAAVSGLLSEEPGQTAHAIDDLNAAVGDVTAFVAENREALGTTSDKLASTVKALAESLDDIKQALHTLPNALQNFVNIWDPAHGSITGILGLNNFSNPITFLCGAIQAASRLNNEQSAKLCVQYLAPIMKNRQYNFPPIGVNPFLNAKARPNEVTYSEDWMRPDYRPPPATPAAPPADAAPAPAAIAAPPTGPLSPAEAPSATNPADGLRGMMVPPGSGG